MKKTTAFRLHLQTPSCLYQLSIDTQGHSIIYDGSTNDFWVSLQQILQKEIKAQVTLKIISGTHSTFKLAQLNQPLPITLGFLAPGVVALHPLCDIDLNNNLLLTPNDQPTSITVQTVLEAEPSIMRISASDLQNIIDNPWMQQSLINQSSIPLSVVSITDFIKNPAACNADALTHATAQHILENQKALAGLTIVYDDSVTALDVNTFLALEEASRTHRFAINFNRIHALKGQYNSDTLSVRTWLSLMNTNLHYDLSHITKLEGTLPETLSGKACGFILDHFPDMSLEHVQHITNPMPDAITFASFKRYHDPRITYHTITQVMHPEALLAYQSDLQDKTIEVNAESMTYALLNTLKNLDIRYTCLNTMLFAPDDLPFDNVDNKSWQLHLTPGIYKAEALGAHEWYAASTDVIIQGAMDQVRITGIFTPDPTGLFNMRTDWTRYQDNPDSAKYARVLDASHKQAVNIDQLIQAVNTDFPHLETLIVAGHGWSMETLNKLDQIENSTLKTLDISGNALTMLHQNFTHLTGLRHLIIDNNQADLSIKSTPFCKDSLWETFSMRDALGIITIQAKAFENTHSTNLTFDFTGSPIHSIERYAFSGITAQQFLIYCDNIHNHIGQWAFSNMNVGTMSMHFAHVERIQMYAFSHINNTTGLCTIQFQDVGIIGTYAFSNIKHMHALNLTFDTIVKIKEHAFSAIDCATLNVTINTMTRTKGIEKEAFHHIHAKDFYFTCAHLSDIPDHCFCHIDSALTCQINTLTGFVSPLAFQHVLSQNAWQDASKKTQDVAL